MHNEPVSLYAAVTGAVIATVNLLGLIFNWSADLIASLNLCLIAWVGVGAFIVRSLVSPVAVVSAVGDPVTVHDESASTPD